MAQTQAKSLGAADKEAILPFCQHKTDKHFLFVTKHDTNSLHLEKLKKKRLVYSAPQTLQRRQACQTVP
jgi:hypothetical protein